MTAMPHEIRQDTHRAGLASPDFHALAARRQLRDAACDRILDAAKEDWAASNRKPSPERYKIVLHALRLAAKCTHGERLETVGRHRLRSNFARMEKVQLYSLSGGDAQFRASTRSASSLYSSESRRQIDDARAFIDRCRSLALECERGEETWFMIELWSRYPSPATLEEIAAKLVAAGRGNRKKSSVSQIAAKCLDRIAASLIER